MNKVRLLITFAAVLIYFPLSSQSLSAIFSYATFKDLKEGAYIETYLLVNGSSVNFVENDRGAYQAKIEVTMIFKQNDTVQTFSKYELLSPEIADTLETNFNFLDQQRLLLAEGAYDFELYIADMHAETEPFFATDVININFPEDTVVISDIQLVESYTETQTPNILSKAGYDLTPSLVNYYPQDKEKLIFYSEIYNTTSQFGEGEAFALSMYIEPWETRRPLPNFNRLRREPTRDVNIVFGEFSIKDLPSGNYNLVIEVRDRENNVVSQRKSFFYRSNPGMKYDLDDISSKALQASFVSQINNIDTLTDYINSLYPISTQMERAFAENSIRQEKIDDMQRFFYNFWHSRDMLNPEGAWKSYKEKVDIVNRLYGTRIHKGYETDRGRVYLQYGPPNSIAKSDFEPSAYPYEIWHYYTIANQTNRRFVFLLREFATNNYELIHSDALGEIYNPRWQIRIHQRDTPTHSLDPENAERHWGGRVDDFFRNPR